MNYDNEKKIFQRVTLVDSEKSYSKTSSNVALIDETIRYRIDLMAKRYPDRIAYTFSHQSDYSITYYELKRQVDEMSQSLLHLGLNKGDRIAYQLCNIYQIIIILFSAANIGLIAVPLDPYYFSFDLEYMLKKTDAKCIFIMDKFENVDYYDVLKEICPELETSLKGSLQSARLPKLKHVVIVKISLNNQSEDELDKCYSGAWAYEEVSSINKLNYRPSYVLPDIDVHDPLIIGFTSGTTGVRKSCTMSNFSYINMTYFVSLVTEKFNGLEMCCVAYKMIHVVNPIMAIMSALFSPFHIIFPSYSSNITDILTALEKYKCKSLIAPPKIIYDILRMEELPKFSITSLEYIYSGSQPVTKQLIDDLTLRFSLKKFIVFYGMTENIFVSFSSFEDELEDEKTITSLGKPLPYMECKIVDPASGQIQPIGVRGELWVKGYNVMMSYWNDSEKKDEVLNSEGWLKTGDILSMDKKGYLYYVDRLKEIIFGSQKTYPSEVEAAIREHPNVSAVQVFGVKKSDFEDIPCAWIILKDPSKTSLDDLKAFCQKRISHYNNPKHIKIVKDFPTSSIGKILKSEMSKIYKQELNI